mgnify:FL=1
MALAGAGKGSPTGFWIPPLTKFPSYPYPVYVYMRWRGLLAGLQLRLFDLTMREPNPSCGWMSLLFPTLALAAGGFVFGHTLGGNSELLAAPTASLDLDGDGLVDVQEMILGTNALVVDSDGDGYSDLEEFSRASDPTDLYSAPSALSEPAVAMTGRAQGGVFHAVTTIYVPNGDLTGTTVTFGALVEGKLYNVDPMLFFVGADLTVHPASNGTDSIYVLETPIPEYLLLALGSTGIYATFSPAGATSITHVSALNLTGINGVVCQVVPTLGGSGPGSMYRPLSDGPDLPLAWNPSSICVQDLHTIGVVGPILQQQIDASSCDPIGADSYCPPDCNNLAGTIVEMIDPLALIGG